MLRAGAAALSVEPPLGLPMIGYVRRYQHAQGYGSELEVTALALESGSTRVVMVGVDTVGIQRPEVDDLRQRVAEAAEADLAGVLLNWSHTHCAPPGGRSLAVRALGGQAVGDAEDFPPALAGYIDTLHEKVVSVARLAAQRLEPAAIAWGLGRADLAVNRRERTPEGKVILGWRPDGLVDNSVTGLQARRRDGSVIATVVNFGCHTVAVGPDVLDYSADFVGPMRRYIRQWTGGEAIFLQGAAGNVLPLVAFAGHAEAETFGRRLALEALHALADRTAGVRRLYRSRDGSATPFALYRFASEPVDQMLAAVHEDVSFPLLPLPSLKEITGVLHGIEAAIEDARRRGAGPAELNVHLYHLAWARQTEAAVREGRARPDIAGPIHAVRVGDGAVVTGPGEIFSEIGLAVKERSPASPTLYAGYTNGAISYFPTAASYPEGGYEPEFGNHSYGLPAQVAPECEQILVDRSVRILERLFPEHPRYGGESWTASGRLPELAAEPPLQPPPWP